MAKKLKYEVLHPIRIERRKVVKRGAVIELDGAQAYEFEHAIRLVPGQEDEGTTVADVAEPPQDRDEAPEPLEEDQVEDADENVVSSEDQEDDPEEVREQQDEEGDQENDIDADETVRQESGEVRVTEAARKEAERQGISLEHVEARGSGGTLTKTDVQRYAKELREEQEDNE